MYLGFWGFAPKRRWRRLKTDCPRFRVFFGVSAVFRSVSPSFQPWSASGGLAARMEGPDHGPRPRACVERPCYRKMCAVGTSRSIFCITKRSLSLIASLLWVNEIKCHHPKSVNTLRLPLKYEDGPA